MRVLTLKVFAVAGAAGLVSLLSGCSLFHQKKPHKPAASEDAQPHRIGTVALVNEDMKFVLIDVGSSFAPQRGLAAKTFTNGQESGIVAITGERQPPFIAADIVKGSPQKGDDVLQ